MEDKVSVGFTVIILVAGTALLIQQGYFSRMGGLNPMDFTVMKMKVVYEGDDPELVAYIPPSKLSAYPTIMGEPVPEDGAITLGWTEARDMSQENNITASQALWGFELGDFLGRPANVTGMLKKTDTLLDMMHILPPSAYDTLPPGVPITVKYTEDKMPKFFYPMDLNDPQWPEKAVFAAGSKEGYKAQRADRQLADLGIIGIDVHFNQNRTYLPVVLGAGEAKMMLNERLITGVGDRIDGFFGRDAYIAGILEPTNTSLDMFHYMPE